MKEQLKSILVLVAICAVVAVLMALTNSITAPIIEQNQAAAASGALLEVLPDGKNFTPVDLAEYTLPQTVKEAFCEDNGGCVFRMETAGYSSGMILMVGISADGTVAGTKCLASGETLGYEKTYGENLLGASTETIDGIDTVAGATKTTTAYRNAVKDALNAAIILGGGAVDIRSEEEILNDNLEAALPGGEDFTEVFITEDLAGIDTVYTAGNGKGSVYVIGEDFIGVDANGKVISDVSAERREAVETAAAILSATELTEIDLSAYEFSKKVAKVIAKAWQTSGGNYVLELKAAGYGINGEYHTSGEYIIIHVAVSPEGKILRCLTVSQKESDGIGSACADSKYYSQFNGKNADNYKEVDSISGATITSDGYVSAIGKVFSIVETLKGDGENEE